ncbi:MAG: hypothetical protein H3C43_05745 [Leptonema sp. (in: Bacteria)]|nr:hypothetical protein [Leptonema sp. (in: bacteria)]
MIGFKSHTKYFIFKFISLFIIVGFASHCQSVQQRIRLLDLSAGAELSDARFFVRAGQLERQFSKHRINTDGTINLNKPSKRYDYFYSVGFTPGPVPFVGLNGLGRYMRFAGTLNSPRTYRGTLRNYPDDGRIVTNIEQAVFFTASPLPEAFGRSSEYVFEEYRGYLTLFFPYYASTNWYIGIGHSYGQSKYNLDLLESNVRIASTRNTWTPLHATQLVMGYRVGRFFERGLFHQTYLFFELINDSSNRMRLDVNLTRSDGLSASSLYYRNTYTRLGIRKTVDLWTSEPTTHSTKTHSNLDTNSENKIEQIEEEKNYKESHDGNHEENHQKSHQEDTNIDKNQSDNPTTQTNDSTENQEPEQEYPPNGTLPSGWQ